MSTVLSYIERPSYIQWICYHDYYDQQYAKKRKYYRNDNVRDTASFPLKYLGTIVDDTSSLI